MYYMYTLYVPYITKYSKNSQIKRFRSNEKSFLQSFVAWRLMLESLTLDLRNCLKSISQNFEVMWLHTCTQAFRTRIESPLCEFLCLFCYVWYTCTSSCTYYTANRVPPDLVKFANFCSYSRRSCTKTCRYTIFSHAFHHLCIK